LTVSAAVETTSSVGGGGGTVGVGGGVGTGVGGSVEAGEGVAVGPSDMMAEAAGKVAELPAAVLVAEGVDPASVLPVGVGKTLVLPLQETTARTTTRGAAMRTWIP
jgi:hypothetical protein